MSILDLQQFPTPHSHLARKLHNTHTVHEFRGLTAQNLVRRPHQRPRFIIGSSPCEDKHCGEGTCCVTHLLHEIFLSELHNILSAKLSGLHPKNAKSKDERTGQRAPLQHLVRRWMVLPESLPTATGDVLSVVKSDVVCV